MLLPINMPDIGIQNMVVSLWYARVGDWVLEGERLVEILAGAAIFDVSAPATGRLQQRLALIDDPVQAGQTLGFIQGTDE